MRLRIILHTTAIPAMIIGVLVFLSAKKAEAKIFTEL